MTAGVYAIHNTVTGRHYIGSTVNFKARWAAHRSQLKTGAFYGPERMLADLLAYGAMTFTAEMLEEVDPDDDALEEAERRWIAHFFAMAPDSLYNVHLNAHRPRRTPAHQNAAAARRFRERRRCRSAGGE